ncbi:MAG: L-2-hydroxyglutarate oxidase [Solirubrobacteraceae bacterium]|nr:L-2-hydroxyglutarate oxidase [Solirubrobacteraceae bacterium]
MRLVVVGGGILGLAAARLATVEGFADEVVVLEKEPAPATHQTGRNSGVVHAGLYYEPGSLKARLCRRGVGLLSDYCAANGVPWEDCGKVLVAADAVEAARLEGIAERATANGVPGIEILDRAGLAAVEPHASGVAALHSPTTAITDYAAVARSFAREVEGAGGQVRTGVRAVRVEQPGGPAVVLEGGERVAGDRVLVCAGLQSDLLARASGRPADPAIIPFRGEYWALRPQRAGLVRGLVYPVPDPGLPFLGVHLTRCVDGRVLVGPNAVLAGAREGYRRRDIDRAELRRSLAAPGLRRLVARHPRAVAAELGRSGSRRLFARGAARLVPGITAGDLEPSVAGVRAQAVDRDGTLVEDFRLESAGGVAWVRNAPSPAATASMAIAEELLGQLSG